MFTVILRPTVALEVIVSARVTSALGVYYCHRSLGKLDIAMKFTEVCISCHATDHDGLECSQFYDGDTKMPGGQRSSTRYAVRK